MDNIVLDKNINNEELIEIYKNIDNFIDYLEKELKTGEDHNATGDR